ncbi:hypothetical protein AK830_g11407 [Neonectria ditissima]|uniref:Uncharacterized protein n=1 Tax=Neonectria ditissima TaxID=78410 RepID=A0A0P7AMI5_9HYPO|nr:hypothetical protein AK830_g11407 [Neonectria ditissima]
MALATAAEGTHQTAPLGGPSFSAAGPLIAKSSPKDALARVDRSQTDRGVAWQDAVGLISAGKREGGWGCLAMPGLSSKPRPVAWHNDAAVYKFQALSAGGCPGHVVQNDSKLYGSLSMDAAVDTLISRHVRQATEHLPSNSPPTALQLDLEEIALIMWSRYKRRGFCFDGMFQGGLAFNDSDNKVRIEIHRDDMIVLVHNIIDHVTELISGLYEAAVKTHEAAPKGVFLTGGLFQSDYIRNEVCNKLPRILGDNGLRVMAPDGDVWWSAVCRGAALCMLPDE